MKKIVQKIAAWLSLVCILMLSLSSAVYATYSLNASITASGGTFNDRFGSDVAVDQYLVVGAEGYNSDAGAAYVYKYTGGAWVQKQRLTASDAAASDSFGSSVDTNGDYVIVGAPAKTVSSQSGAGAAYIFKTTNSGESWTQVDSITHNSPAVNDQFGGSVAISSSGTYVLVGVGSDDDAGASSGTVKAFKNNGSDDFTTPTATIESSDIAAGDLFGSNVDISGTYAVITAEADTHTSLTNAGSAYVFTRSGDTWSQQQKLTASDAAASDFYGSHASIDGTRTIVGAPNDDDNGSNTGSAYVYTLSGSTWGSQVKLNASDYVAGDKFGSEVVVNGSYAGVGAYNYNSRAGKAYGYVLGGSWSEDSIITESSPSAANDFGASLAQTSAGDLYVTSVGNNADTGKAYYYTYSASGVPEFGTYAYIMVLLTGFGLIYRTAEKQRLLINVSG